MSDKPSALNELLRQQLLVAHELDQQILAQNTSGTLLEIPNTGTLISSAYEQLRNAAEYGEEHLLLQKAIKRFFKRNLFVSKRQRHDLGLELIIDLTQAGYLQGRQFSENTTESLRQLIERYMATHKRLRQAHIPRETADNWVLALLATDIENILNPHNVLQSTLFAAYTYFLHAIPKEQFVDLPNADSYELCLYIAVHQAILKSDIDVIRHALHHPSLQSLEDTHGFIQLSKRIDELFVSPLTQALKRVISRHSAPFRVLKSLSDNYLRTEELLPHKQQFLEAYNRQIDVEYQRLDQRLARGLLKSVAFIIITKLLIGAAIEVPYDLLTVGSIALLPLAVNLLFPPLYMISHRLSLRLPSLANKRSIHNYMEQLLYDDTQVHIPALKRRRTTLSTVTRLMYTFMFVLPVGCTLWALHAIGFNVVQMIIFFVFFSTATFLGFRLSAMVRELELTTKPVGLFASLQDFFYLPFAFLGQWLSRKYSQINIVARFMDIAIELPLKSLLRLLQQWINFLRERHEELY